MGEPAIKKYELGNRTPNNKQHEIIVLALDISIHAISNPGFETEHGAMHALYYLEENFDFKIKKEGSDVSLVSDNRGILSRLLDWGDIYNDCQSGKIEDEEYTNWKDTYPTKAVFNKE